MVPFFSEFWNAVEALLPLKSFSYSTDGSGDDMARNLSTASMFYIYIPKGLWGDSIWWMWSR